MHIYVGWNQIIHCIVMIQVLDREMRPHHIIFYPTTKIVPQHLVLAQYTFMRQNNSVMIPLSQIIFHTFNCHDRKYPL